MFRRKRLTLGGWLLIALIAFVLSLFMLLSSTSLLWYGITTQGVIVGENTARCGKYGGVRNGFTVQFTDRTGQVHVSGISQCDYPGFNASPGDSVTIVYVPGDPRIAPPDPDVLIASVQNWLSLTILTGLLTLILLPLWIRKQIQKRSLQDQQGQIESSVDPVLPKQPLAFPPLPESSLTSTSAIPWLKASYHGSETSITGSVTLSIVHQSQDGVLRAKWIRDDFGVEYSCEGTITREGTFTLMSTDSHRDSALRIHGSILENGHLEGILYAISKDGSSQRHSWSLA